MTTRRGQPPKNTQGAFEAIDDRGKILLESRDHAAEPAVAERHDEALNHARLATTEFLQRAKPTEVRFRHFPRGALSPPHADRGGSKATPLPRKSIQGAIGDQQPLAP